MKHIWLYLTIFTFLRFHEVTGHIKLTFPPARPYAFDFLDNVHTGLPCGVKFDEDNQIMTTLVADESINITWHVAYPHLGGVKFELLDAEGEVLTQLTDNEWIHADDSAATTHTLTIPADHVCDHCILKISKEANEWRDIMDEGEGDQFWMGYVFWSCADVTVVAADTVTDGCYDGKCLNGGTCDAGVCTCVDKFEGERCENENDCTSDEDCTSQGSCVTIDATSYPKQVCFCEAGFMGRHCDRESSLEEAVLTEEEEADYHKITLYEDPHLFEILWKFVGDDENEIEFAVRAKTDTWSAVGWRPVDLDERCKDFPVQLLPAPVEVGGSNDTAGNDTAAEESDDTAADTDDAAVEEDAVEGGGETLARKRRSVSNCRVRRRRTTRVEDDYHFSHRNRTKREAEEGGEVEEEEEISMIEQLCLSDGLEESTDWAKWAFIYDDDGARGGRGTKLPDVDDILSHVEDMLTPENILNTIKEYIQNWLEPFTRLFSFEDEDDADVKEQYFGEDSHDSFTQVLDRHQLHHMDCTDIVFASEHEGKHRIIDMYTRDRSTPQPDSWYNGTDDLTAAVATRVDGILHIRFRRNLTTGDPTDHGFSDTPFRLNWARGQTPTKFWHNPMSGLEMCKTSDYGFYRVNELKYHGTRITQRGSQLYNIYEDPEVEDEDSVMHADMYRYPEGCSGDTCTYKAFWKCRKADGRVFFKVEARVEEGRWAAIGFSEDQNMESTDAAVGWVEPSNGELTLTDRWIAEDAELDTTDEEGNTTTIYALDNGPSSLEDVNGHYNDGVLTFEFSRALDTEDLNDLKLTECVYFLYSWGGEVADGDLTIHEEFAFSEQKICVGSSSTRSISSTSLLIICISICIYLLQ